MTPPRDNNAATAVTPQRAIVELTRRACLESFWSFCLYMEYDFFSGRETPLKEIAHAFDRAYRQGLRIALSTPPRTGKSTIVNYFVAWLLLIDQDNAIIRGSYSSTLSQELHSQTRDIIKSPRFERLVNYDLNIDNASQMKLKGSHRMNLLATSVGGSVTGFGCNTLILDDAYKDHLEAGSETINRKTITWYHSAFASRLDGAKQCEIMIGTRWRNGELVDVLESGGYFDEVIKIQALTKDETSFNENIITTDKILKLKNTMHISLFNSMYQQEPIEVMSSLIKIQDFEKVSPSLRQHSYEYRIATIDVSDKGSDCTTLAIVDTYKDGPVLRDVYSSAEALETTGGEMLAMLEHYKPTHVFIEENSNSYWVSLFAQKLRSKGIQAFSFWTSKNKQDKILLNSMYVKQIKMLDTDNFEYNEFMRKACRYDLSLKDQHDDEIDVLAMSVDKIIEVYGGWKWD